MTKRCARGVPSSLSARDGLLAKKISLCRHARTSATAAVRKVGGRDRPLVPFDALVLDQRSREKLGKDAAAECDAKGAAAVDRLNLSCRASGGQREHRVTRKVRGRTLDDEKGEGVEQVSGVSERREGEEDGLNGLDLRQRLE